MMNSLLSIPCRILRISASLSSAALAISGSNSTTLPRRCALARSKATLALFIMRGGIFGVIRVDRYAAADAERQGGVIVAKQRLGLLDKGLGVALGIVDRRSMHDHAKFVAAEV